MTHIDSTSDVTLPDHPLWCKEDPCDVGTQPFGWHQSDTLHTEAQNFEIGVSATIVQADDWPMVGKREAGEPSVRIELDDRNGGDGSSAVGVFTLTELRALVAMLGHQVRELEGVHAAASGAAGLAWAVGWTPEADVA